MELGDKSSKVVKENGGNKSIATKHMWYPCLNKGEQREIKGGPGNWGLQTSE